MEEDDNEALHTCDKYLKVPYQTATAPVSRTLCTMISEKR